MSELAMIFIGGLLGSSHCIGMCGGFALSIGAAAAGPTRNLLAQGIYSLGRVSTYTLIGAIVGEGGAQLMHGLSAAVPMQAVLALLAGVLLLGQGLHSCGLLSRRVTGKLSCPALGAFGRLLASGHKLQLFLAGVLTALLPCGFVYAFIALASASGSLASGGLHMLAFGLGTVPLMVLAGYGGSVVNFAARRRLLRLAGWCVLITGVVSLARGVSFLTASEVANGSCPFCH